MKQNDDNSSTSDHDHDPVHDHPPFSSSLRSPSSQCLCGESSLSSTTQTAKNAATNLLTVVCQAAAPLYHGVVMNLFGAAGYGIYAPALIILEIPTRAGVCGMDFGLMRKIPMHRAKGDTALEAAAVGTALRVTFLSGIFLALIINLFTYALRGVFGAGTTASEILAVLGILAFSLPFVLVTVALASLTLATQTARGNFWIRGVTEPIAMLIGLLAAALSGGGVTALAIAHVAASAVATTVAFAVTARIYGGRRLARAIFGAPHHRAMERFSLPLAVSELLAALSQYFHALLLPLWVADAALLGIFFGAEYFARAINNTRYGFDTIFCPIVSEAHERGDRARIQENLSLLSRWVFSLALPLVLLFSIFPETILSIAGRDFHSGALFLVAFAIAMGLYSAFGLTGWVIAMTGRSRLTLLNNAIAVLANLVLSLALVPKHGAYGALIATIAAMLVVRFLENIEAFALERVHLIHPLFFKPLIAAAASCAAQLLLAPLIADPLARVLVATSVGFVAYLISFVALGLTVEEWRIVERIKWVRRFRGGATT